MRAAISEPQDCRTGRLGVPRPPLEPALLPHWPRTCVWDG